MRWGIFSGMLWGLDTVILGITLGMATFSHANSPLLTAALHDSFCAILMLVLMASKGRLTDTRQALHTRAGKAVIGAALLGGPIGMSGYALAINNIGSGYTAILSTFYPALGTFLATVFLKERMRVRQLMALTVALIAIIILGSSSLDSTTGSIPLGILGAVLCIVGWGSEAVILAWGMRDDAVDNHVALHLRQSTSGLAFLLIVIPVSGNLSALSAVVSTPASAIIVLAALAGTASYLFYYRAINTIGAARAMALNISYSAWAIIFAIPLMAVLPSIFDVIGCLVILIATVLAASSQWRELIQFPSQKSPNKPENTE
ncbi:DMT family transporter [Arcanobacterium buesumense]|uniref:DMT family transporter n=1 Tax=Arcanobacterium buesumense TaxID=2722751 RepID=A0A6H2EIJ3_9ACTO|nr:DMT family transporter [Arcanobacterium buesumense]QJC21136.1 DMT family transporter [Arcanobacterium buesumense]